MKKNSFRNSIRTVFFVLVLCCFTLAQAVEAGGPRGVGGGRGGGGGGRSGGGGGGRQNMQANHGRADARTNNVRSTSVNNVNRNANQNVNRNVNVNNNVNIDRDVHIDVDNHGGCCNNGWDNDHPIATAAAVTATVMVTAAVVGSLVRTVPPGCVPVNYGGIIYQQCGSTWYQPQGSQFVVINAPY